MKDSLNKQHQCHVELNYLETKLEHLKCIREAYSFCSTISVSYEEEKHAWEENLSFFKTPLSLTSTEAGDCTFDGINDTTTLSNLYEDVRHSLSTSHTEWNASLHPSRCPRYEERDSGGASATRPSLSSRHAHSLERQRLRLLLRRTRPCLFATIYSVTYLF